MEIRSDEERMEDARMWNNIRSVAMSAQFTEPEGLSPSEYRWDVSDRLCPPSPLLRWCQQTQTYVHGAHDVCLSTIKLSKGVSSTYSEHYMSYERKQEQNTERVQAQIIPETPGDVSWPRVSTARSSGLMALCHRVIMTRGLGINSGDIVQDILALSRN